MISRRVKIRNFNFKRAHLILNLVGTLFTVVLITAIIRSNYSVVDNQTSQTARIIYGCAHLISIISTFIIFLLTFVIKPSSFFTQRYLLLILLIIQMIMLLTIPINTTTVSLTCQNNYTIPSDQNNTFLYDIPPNYLHCDTFTWSPFAEGLWEFGRSFLIVIFVRLLRHQVIQKKRAIALESSIRKYPELEGYLIGGKKIALLKIGVPRIDNNYI